LCLSVCLYARFLLADYSKTTDQIYTKFYGLVGHNPGRNQLDFERP